jgi:hypothetical protein
VFGKFEEVNLSSCNLPVTFALKDTPNLGILDLSVRFLAGAFWRESFSGLPSTHPSYHKEQKQPITSTTPEQLFLSRALMTS